MATNMDVTKNKNATAPVLEFRLPVSEVDSQVKLGDSGYIRIPAEVVEVSDGMITFRKCGKCELEDMKEEKLDRMKERMGTVDDYEEPFKKD